MPPPPVDGVFGSTGAGARVDGWVMMRLLQPPAAPLPRPPCASPQGPTAATPPSSAPPHSTQQRGGLPTLSPHFDQHPRAAHRPTHTPAHHPPAPRPGSPHEPVGWPGPTTRAGGTAVEGRLAVRATAGRAVGSVASQRKPTHHASSAVPAVLFFFGRHHALAAVAAPPLSTPPPPPPPPAVFALRPTRGPRGTSAADGAVLPLPRPFAVPIDAVAAAVAAAAAAAAAVTARCSLLAAAARCRCRAAAAAAAVAAVAVVVTVRGIGPTHTGGRRAWGGARAEAPRRRSAHAPPPPPPCLSSFPRRRASTCGAGSARGGGGWGGCAAEVWTGAPPLMGDGTPGWAGRARTLFHRALLITFSLGGWPSNGTLRLHASPSTGLLTRGPPTSQAAWWPPSLPRDRRRGAHSACRPVAPHLSQKETTTESAVAPLFRNAASLAPHARLGLGQPVFFSLAP